MIKALVIGCGKIGALYDLDNDKVLTHAKAIHLDNRFSLSVYDVNKNLARRVCKKYNCEEVKILNHDNLQGFDCVSICTPTNTHIEYLKATIKAGVKLVICEKPVSDSANELNAAKTMYLNGTSKVLVNYIRRFQPAFADLKRYFRKLARTESLINICIRYQKGFLNNCSHAFDTIEYLMDTGLVLKNRKIPNSLSDHFSNDPTLSMQALWNNTNVNVIGLSNIKFQIFEIDFNFEYHRIMIKDSGNRIEIFKAQKSNKEYLPLLVQDQLTKEDCLQNYMVHVFHYAHDLIKVKNNKDNFLNSLELNIRMANYLKN